jgi:RHS repeat-associated protein
VGGQTTTYGYDAFGNLRSVNLPDGSIQYVIDGESRRVGRVTGTAFQAFLYDDQLRIAAEFDGTTGQVTSRFVYAGRVNVPELMVRDGQVYRMITDHLGSVRLVVNVTTGQIVERIDYDEFGVASLVVGSWSWQPFGFAGGIHDADTHLVRFGARDYEPSMGRWILNDPIRFRGGLMSLYVYALNDPINIADPFGLRCVNSSPYCWVVKPEDSGEPNAWVPSGAEYEGPIDGVKPGRFGDWYKVPDNNDVEIDPSGNVTRGPNDQAGPLDRFVPDLPDLGPVTDRAPGWKGPGFGGRVGWPEGVEGECPPESRGSPE